MKLPSRSLLENLKPVARIMSDKPKRGRPVVRKDKPETLFCRVGSKQKTKLFTIAGRDKMTVGGKVGQLIDEAL